MLVCDFLSALIEPSTYWHRLASISRKAVWPAIVWGRDIKANFSYQSSERQSGIAFNRAFGPRMGRSESIFEGKAVF
jgi:hypothetical protein